MRVLLRQRHSIVLRLWCESLAQKHHTNLPAALYQNIKCSSSPDVFYHTALTRQSSPATPTVSTPYTHPQPIFTHRLVMNAVQEEKNPKRQREGDGTLSPPAKKTQHIKPTQVGEESKMDEIFSAATFSQHDQPQGGEVKTPDSDVVMAEERINQENFQNEGCILKGGEETNMGEVLPAPTFSQHGQPQGGEVKATESDVVEEVRQEPTHMTEKNTELKSNRETEDNFTVKKSAMDLNTKVEMEKSNKLIVIEGREDGFPVGGEPVMELTMKGITEVGVLSSGREIKEESDTRRDVTPGERTAIEQSPGEPFKVDIAPEKQTDTKGHTYKELSPVPPLREFKPIETVTELTEKETFKGELMPQEQDMDSMSLGKEDNEIPLMGEENTGEMASVRSQNLSASKIDRKQPIQTHTLDRQPTDRLTDEPRDTDKPTDLLDQGSDISLGSRTEKRSKTKEKKHSSQKRKKGNHSGERRDLRPNYFVGIQVSNPTIHQGLLKVQEDLVAWNDVMVKALVDIATSHLTLLVAHIGTEEALAVACAALEESAKRLGDGVSACPLHLNFSGVSSFSNQVIFARVEEDDHYQRLLDMGECVRRVFEERGVCMPDTRELHPHLTIAKLSKAPHRKGKPGVKKVDPSCYSHHYDRHFGTQTVAGLQLLSMNKGKDECRYYHSEKEVLFDINMEESKDHSACCFPRRPVLPITQTRAYTTTTTTTEAREEEEGSGGGRWMMPVAGVATLVAAALVMGFVLARVRGSQ